MRIIRNIPPSVWPGNLEGRSGSVAVSLTQFPPTAAIRGRADAPGPLL
jgi:hypothetical protein